MSQLASHGRGGAGNMADATQSPKIQPSDLETPTLKTPVVTTGRGGTGNMAKNLDPAETRLRQDVQAVPRSPGHGVQHSGRGGAGNVIKDMEKENDAKVDRQETREQSIPDEADSNISGEDGAKIEKAAEKPAKKHWLFGKGKA